MASLLWFSVKWYGMVAILVALIVVPAGLYFFTSNYKSGAEIVWQMPWSFLGVVTAGLLAISPLTAIVEGDGSGRRNRPHENLPKCPGEPSSVVGAFFRIEALFGAHLYDGQFLVRADLAFCPLR